MMDGTFENKENNAPGAITVISKSIDLSTRVPQNVFDSSRQDQIIPLSTYRIPRNRRRTGRNHNKYKTGSWSEFEQRQFLHGLITYGWGQWKEIGTIVTTRYV
jgi:hypothetical protein